MKNLYVYLLVVVLGIGCGRVEKKNCITVHDNGKRYLLGFIPFGNVKDPSNQEFQKHGCLENEKEDNQVKNDLGDVNISNSNNYVIEEKNSEINNCDDTSDQENADVYEDSAEQSLTVQEEEEKVQKVGGNENAESLLESWMINNIKEGEYVTTGEGQKHAYEYAKNLISNLISNNKNNQEKSAILYGDAGRGKSTIVTAIESIARVKKLQVAKIVYDRDANVKYLRNARADLVIIEEFKMSCELNKDLCSVLKELNDNNVPVIIVSNENISSPNKHDIINNNGFTPFMECITNYTKIHFEGLSLRTKLEINNRDDVYKELDSLIEGTSKKDSENIYLVHHEKFMKIISSYLSKKNNNKKDIIKNPNLRSLKTLINNPYNTGDDIVIFDQVNLFDEVEDLAILNWKKITDKKIPIFICGFKGDRGQYQTYDVFSSGLFNRINHLTVGRDSIYDHGIEKGETDRIKTRIIELKFSD